MIFEGFSVYESQGRKTLQYPAMVKVTIMLVHQSWKGPRKLWVPKLAPSPVALDRLYQ